MVSFVGGFFFFYVKNPACITWSQDKGSCYSLMEMRIPWVYAKVCHQPSRTPDNWFHFLILQVSPISYEIRAMENLNVLLKVLFCRLKKPWQHKATTLLTSRDKLESVTAFETSVVWAKSKLFYQTWCTLKELQKYPQKGGISDKKGRKKWSKNGCEMSQQLRCFCHCYSFSSRVFNLLDPLNHDTVNRTTA